MSVCQQTSVSGKQTVSGKPCCCWNPSGIYNRTQTICITRYHNSQLKHVFVILFELNLYIFFETGWWAWIGLFITTADNNVHLHPQPIQYLLKGFCTYSTVDGQCCLSHGGDGGAAMVSALTQFPENPLPLQRQLWQNAGDYNLWSWMI